MINKTILLFFLTATISIYGQANQELIIKNQANIMGKAFMNNDFKTYVKYVNPKIVAMLGGEIKMAEVINKTITDMKSKGIIFDDITFSEPTKIIKSGTELQSTIQQHTKVKTPNGAAESISTLIAISINQGVSWTFIDTTNKTITAIRQLLPNLSAEIVIPKQVPVKYF